MRADLHNRISAGEASNILSDLLDYPVTVTLQPYGSSYDFAIIVAPAGHRLGAANTPKPIAAYRVREPKEGEPLRLWQERELMRAAAVWRYLCRPGIEAAEKEARERLEQANLRGHELPPHLRPYAAPPVW